MLTKILKACSFGVIAFWLVTLGWLLSECYCTGYDGPMWEWQYLGVDHWKALTTIESCMSWDVHKIAGEGGVRVWWNMPVLGVLLWWLAALLPRRQRERYTEAEIQDIRGKARPRL